jgi:hypothetical protein
MIEYALKGLVMTLSVDTSRRCGHLIGGGGAGLDSATRQEVRADVQLLADQLGKSIEVHATRPDGQSWRVEVVEPKADPRRVELPVVRTRGWPGFWGTIDRELHKGRPS